MKTNRWMALAATLALVTGCDEASPGEDAGPTMADAGTDAGLDAAPPGDGGLDAGPVGCSVTGCGPDEACLREVCVATCGADASGWDSALAADLTPVAVYCRTAAAFGTHIGGGGTDVFDVTTAMSAGGTEMTLSRWALETSGAPMPAPVAMMSVSHDPGTSLFPGGYVVASPGGGRVAYGYTLSDAGFSGEVFEVATSDGAATAVDAPGNFDAVWLNDDVVLLNGLGVAGTSGQALYAIDLSSGSAVARQVLTGLGSASGSVELVGDHVLVGGLDDSFTGHVYAVSRSAIEAAIGEGGAPMAVGPGDELLRDGASVPSAFERVHELFVTARYDASFSLEALEAYPIEAGPALGAPADLTTGDTFTSAHEASRGGILLRFAEGLLLVERPAG